MHLLYQQTLITQISHSLGNKINSSKVACNNLQVNLYQHEHHMLSIDEMKSMVKEAKRQMKIKSKHKPKPIEGVRVRNKSWSPTKAATLQVTTQQPPAMFTNIPKKPKIQANPKAASTLLGKTQSKSKK